MSCHVIQAPFPDVHVVDSLREGTVLTALFFGYSSAMLGVTGFETSANFVEEQKPGVYPRTLRNMVRRVMCGRVRVCTCGSSVFS